MPAHFQDLEMKAFNKLHKINISRTEMDQRNEVKNLVEIRNLKNFDEFEGNFFTRDTGMPVQFQYLSIKVYKKLHKINISRRKRIQHN